MNFSTHRRPWGFSLVELMIALVLGSLVVAGASGIFLSNRRAYASTETLGRLQESARVAFELMARDVREAGGNPCGKNIPVANILNNGSSAWYTNFQQGLQGYDNGALAGSSTGTDAIELLGATTDDVQLVSYNPASAVMDVTSNRNFVPGDLALICDYTQGAAFQITHLPGSGKLGHNTGNGTPGNCTKDFSYPVNCGSKNLKVKVFSPGATVARFSAMRWYIGDTPNGRALFRSSTRSTGGVPAPVAEEVAEGVQDMQITYLVSGAVNYVAANAVAAADWKKVTAVKLTLTFEARDGTEKGLYIQGTDNKKLSRVVSHVVTLRNRMS